MPQNTGQTRKKRRKSPNLDEPSDLLPSKFSARSCRQSCLPETSMFHALTHTLTQEVASQSLQGSGPCGGLVGFKIRRLIWRQDVVKERRATLRCLESNSRVSGKAWSRLLSKVRRPDIPQRKDQSQIARRRQSDQELSRQELPELATRPLIMLGVFWLIVWVYCWRLGQMTLSQATITWVRSSEICQR